MLQGGRGNDKLAGHEGDDDVFAADGNDRDFFEFGDDTGDGGLGADTIIFQRAQAATRARGHPICNERSSRASPSPISAAAPICGRSPDHVTS